VTNRFSRHRSYATKTCLTLGAVSLLVASAQADSLNKDWDNGAANNDFGNATNWNSNTLPTTGTGNAGDNIRIDLTGANKAIYSASLDNPGAGMTSAQAGIFKRLQIADVSGNGELEITGGVFSTDSTTQTTIGSSGRTGILTVNGAGANVRLGGWMPVGHSTSGTGVVNVVNGTLVSSRNATVGGIPAVSIALGNGNNARGTIKLSGGQLVTRTGVLLGTPGTTGTGRFEVRGAGVASIGTENTADDGFWVQSSNSTLAAYVDNGNLGTIYVDNLDPATGGTYADGNVIFSPGSKLEVGFVGATNAGAWDLMKWEGALLTNGLSFASTVTDTNWSFAFVDTDGTNGPDTLRITYISAGPPTPPTGLVAVPGNSQVTLRWSALNGATNYHVKRATSPGGPYTVTNNASGLSFTNTGLVNGTTYYYVITGATTNGETANFNDVRATPFTSKFVHPGVMHTLADLDRIRTKATAGEQPWLDGYNVFVVDSHSSSIYPMQGPFPTISRNPSQYLSQWENDCGAAYQNAMMWYLTGKPAHATKAIAILDGWASTCTNIIGADARLTAGLQGHKFITAAEIIRYTGAPWSPSQINTCSNFIRTVLLPQNKMYGGGNWGIIGAISQMAAGLFMEDEAEFNDAVNAMKYGAPTECDMGLVNYIDPGGWTTEADRDIGHWSLGLNNDAAGAQIAWCQGLDLWTFLGNRIQVGHEYLAKYNLSNSVSYSPPQQCDGYNNGGITSDGRGRWDIPFYEQAFHPYQNLFGIASPYTEQAVLATRADGGSAEGYDRDHVAFGTLVAALPPRTPGLPVLPSGLVATWNNGVVSLTWSSASGALTYNVKRATARGGPYTNIATSVATTSRTDSTVSNNQLYFYKISAVNATGETADSGLAAAYPSSTAPAAPTNVVAKTISHQRIDLSWNASAGATSYNVKRATSPGGPYTNIATGVGTTFLSYANTGLPAATTFY
jgi:fibronectin type 3 domain-containing protein